MKKQVCVIGLGRFGSTVAHELYQSGHDVLAIDVDEAKIQEQLGKVTYAVRADATHESVLHDLDIPDYDVAIVALGSDNVQASVGITVLLKSIGVPLIIARAANELHGETLERIGADRVLFPEAENARRVARLEFSREVIDYMPILADYGISKIRTPEGMFHHTLEEAELSGSGDRHDISVLAIRRGKNLAAPSRQGRSHASRRRADPGRHQRAAQQAAGDSQKAGGCQVQGRQAQSSQDLIASIDAAATAGGRPGSTGSESAAGGTGTSCPALQATWRRSIDLLALAFGKRSLIHWLPVPANPIILNVR